MIYKYEYPSIVGTLTLASDGPHLCGLWLEGQKYFEEKIEERVLGAKSKNAKDIQFLIGEEALQQSEGLQKTLTWLDAYFAGKDPGALPPLAMHGTEFQEQVWNQLAQIPYGETRTYGDIAHALASHRPNGKISYRAVGSAIGKNPITVIVPCHRVIGANNNLTGYAGGLRRKLQLLDLEGIDTSVFKILTEEA